MNDYKAMTVNERLKLFAEWGALFEGKPIHDYVDDTYFGVVKQKLVREVEGVNFGERMFGVPFVGPMIVHSIPNGKAFVAEACVSDNVAFEGPPGQCARELVSNILVHAAYEASGIPDAIPGPADGIIAVGIGVKAKVFYQPVPDLDEDPILSVRMRIVAARIQR